MIKHYFQPIFEKFGIKNAEEIIDILSKHTIERNCIKGEYLEQPGPASEGRCILLMNSIAHSYECISIKGENIYAGTMIWPRKSLIFLPESLFHNMDILEYTQVLEPGTYLSIRYPVLQQLLRNYPSLLHFFHILDRNHSLHRYKHDILLHLPPKIRVQTFEKQFGSFCKVASIGQRAMHVALSRQSYSRILNNSL